jgi:hypothetical protein
MNAWLWRILGASSVLVSLLTAVVTASNIGLSLNLRYNDPADITEGGTWSLVGLTDDPYGITSVRAILNNVNSNPGDITFPNGLGAVDPVDIGSGPRPAVITNGSVLDLAFGQNLGGSVVTGIGKGAGSPGDIGLDPLYNADWSHASVLATGTFSGSGIPSFSSLSGEFTSGRVLTSSLAPYSAVPAANVSTVVRGDRVGNGAGDLPRGDFNRDFKVDLDDARITWNNFFRSGIGWDEGDDNDDGSVTNFDLKAPIGNMYLDNLPANPVVIPKPPTTTDFELRAEIAGAYNQEFGAVDWDGEEVSEPIYLQVDIVMEIDDLQAHERAFGSVVFDVDLFSVTENVGGWQPDTRQTDINGPSPGGLVSLFATNTDAAIPTDLQAVYISVAPGLNAPGDPRHMIGQSGPEFLGSIFVLWDGTYPAAIELNDIMFNTIDFDGKFLEAHTIEDFVLELEHQAPPDRADFNDDGVVDGLDLAIWQAGYGKSEGPLSYRGDANHDGFVDGRDLLIWQRSFAEAQGNLANVPEPASCSMLLFGFSSLLFRRRSHYSLTP